MASKILPEDLVDLKIHSDYNGDVRCSLVEASMSNIYSMTYVEFCSFLRTEVPRLGKFQVMRVCFLDMENEYIDLTERNFHRFVRLASKPSGYSDTIRINIKVTEGTSPAPVKQFANSMPQRCPDVPARKELSFHRFKSPGQLELDLKKQEVEKKQKEVLLLTEKYEKLSNDYRPNMFRDTSKSLCSNCHTRGHDRKKCRLEQCESAQICGEIDKHSNEKKELTDLAKKKQQAENELKMLKTELDVKDKIIKEVACSFEAKIHDALINTNPDRYLTTNGRPKEGIIKADTYIIRKYYDGKVPQDIEEESNMWQTIIKSYEERMNVKPPKNSVQRELERRGGIRWPSQTDSQTPSLQAQDVSHPVSPYNYWAYGQNYMYAYPGYVGYHAGVMQRPFMAPSATITSPQQALPSTPSVPVVSPPLPDAEEDAEGPPLP